MDIPAALVATAGENTISKSTGMDGDASANAVAAEAYMAGLMTAYQLANSSSALWADTAQLQEGNQLSGSEGDGSESSTSKDDEPDTTSISGEDNFRKDS